MATWQKKIGKRLTAHVREYCGGTLATFKSNFEQARAQGHDCQECKQIADTLGLFTPPKPFEFSKKIPAGMVTVVDTPAGDVMINNLSKVEIYVHARGSI